MNSSSQWSLLMIWRRATTWVNLHCWLQTQCPRPPFCKACCCLAVLQNGLVPINRMRLANIQREEKEKQTKHHNQGLTSSNAHGPYNVHSVWQKKEHTQKVKLWSTHLGSPLSPFKTIILCQNSQNIFHLNLRNTVRKSTRKSDFYFPRDSPDSDV